MKTWPISLWPCCLSLHSTSPLTRCQGPFRAFLGWLWHLLRAPFMGACLDPSRLPGVPASAFPKLWIFPCVTSWPTPSHNPSYFQWLSQPWCSPSPHPPPPPHSFSATAWYLCKWLSNKRVTAILVLYSKTLRGISRSTVCPDYFLELGRPHSAPSVSRLLSVYQSGAGESAITSLP